MRRVASDPLFMKKNKGEGEDEGKRNSSHTAGKEWLTHTHSRFTQCANHTTLLYIAVLVSKGLVNVTRRIYIRD